jgi:hypothetical protein
MGLEIDVSMNPTPTPIPIPPAKKIKPWPEAHAWSGQWEGNSNTGRASTCIQFLQAHGFISDQQAEALRAQLAERSAAAG